MSAPNWVTVKKSKKSKKPVTPQSTPKKPISPQLTYNKWIRGSPMTPKKLNVTPKKTPKKKSWFSIFKKYIVG